MVVCGARGAAVALVIAEASLALSVVGALVAAEGEDVLTEGEACEDAGESEGVGVEQGEGSVISSTCAPVARGATVISAVHESTESFAFCGVISAKRAVLEIVFPAPFLSTRPRTNKVEYEAYPKYSVLLVHVPLQWS